MKKIKKGFSSLSIEEKGVFCSAVFLILSCFLPWLVTENPVDFTEKANNAFSSLLSAHGYTVFFSAIFAVALFVLPFYRIQLPRFLPSKYLLFPHIFIANFVLVFLSILAYTKYSLIDTRADIAFGIYLSFFSSLAGAVASIINLKSHSRKGLMSTKRQSKLFEESKDEDEEETLDIKQKLDL